MTEFQAVRVPIVINFIEKFEDCVDSDKGLDWEGQIRRTLSGHFKLFTKEESFAEKCCGWNVVVISEANDLGELNDVEGRDLEMPSQMGKHELPSGVILFRINKPPGGV